MLIGGIVVVLIAVGLFFGGRAMQGRAAEMAAIQTSTVASLKEEVEGVAKEIGGGSWARQAEVQGSVVCDAPIKGEFSGIDCVHYETTVTREYEETYTETDSNGNRETRTRRGSETVASNNRSVPFMIDDGSGKISVDPAGASLDLEKTFSQYQPGEAVSMGSFVMGAILNVGGRRTLGHRYEEMALPVGRRLYALGEASDANGGLGLRKPMEKGKHYILSLKSKDALVKGSRTGALVMTILSGVAVVGGIILIALGAMGYGR